MHYRLKGPTLTDEDSTVATDLARVLLLLRPILLSNETMAVVCSLFHAFQPVNLLWPKAANIVFAQFKKLEVVLNMLVHVLE
jgi:hypothetical protein